MAGGELLLVGVGVGVEPSPPHPESARPAASGMKKKPRESAVQDKVLNI
jgi:hypothetical protein